MAQIRDDRQPRTRIAGILEGFHRGGVAFVPGVLSAEECALLRARADDLFDMMTPGGWFILRDAKPLTAMYRSLFVRDSIPALAEAILGPKHRYLGSPILSVQPGSVG